MNRLNLWGWANLSARTVSNFGLLMLVSSLGEATDVELWLVAITILATVGTLDGLLGQYFLRAFVWTDASGGSGRDRAHRLQDQVYTALALAICALGAYMMRDLGMWPSASIGVLFALLLLARRLDSRTKAASDLTQFQRVETLLHTVAIGLSVIVFGATRSLVLLLVGYLGWLAIASLLKYRLLYGSLLVRTGVSATGAEADRRDLIKTVMVSVSGALTINLCLLMVSDGLAATEAAMLLLSYRLAMLVCEFASVPIVTRLPELTRRAGSDLGLAKTFPKLGVWGLALTFAGLTMVAAAAPWGFRVLGLELAIYGASPLGLALIGGWVVERANTFLSQALLCSGFFEHAAAFSVFAVVMLGAAVGARQASAPHLMVTTQLVAGVALLPLVLRHYIHIVGLPHTRSR